MSAKVESRFYLAVGVLLDFSKMLLGSKVAYAVILVAFSSILMFRISFFSSVFSQVPIKIDYALE